MKFSAALALVALVLLSGCASIYPTTPTAVHQPMTARPEARAQAVPATGAIYQVAYARPLFEDRRARHMGDTIPSISSSATTRRRAPTPTPPATAA